MFGNKNKENEKWQVKLPSPCEIPSLVKSYMLNTYKVDVDAPNFLQAVLRPDGEKKDKSFDIRVFDPDEAMAIDYKIKDYTSLDTSPELIFYEGRYAEKLKTCSLVEKRKPDFNIELLTEEKISADIESIKEPGNSVYFYTSSGPSSGGPLGRGAAIIELQPVQPGKKPRYKIYSSNVVEMKPVSKRVQVFESNNTCDLAKWVKSQHVKRFC
jgi:hypothetical protein